MNVCVLLSDIGSCLRDIETNGASGEPHCVCLAVTQPLTSFSNNDLGLSTAHYIEY